MTRLSWLDEFPHSLYLRPTKDQNKSQMHSQPAGQPASQQVITWPIHLGGSGFSSQWYLVRVWPIGDIQTHNQRLFLSYFYYSLFSCCQLSRLLFLFGPSSFVIFWLRTFLTLYSVAFPSPLSGRCPRACQLVKLAWSYNIQFVKAGGASRRRIHLVGVGSDPKSSIANPKHVKLCLTASLVMMQLCVHQLDLHVFLHPYLMPVISMCAVVTVVTVSICWWMHCQHCHAAQRLRSSLHSFKTDGLCPACSSEFVIDSSAQTSWRGREHPRAAEESISLLPPEIIIWKSSVLFTPVLFFFFGFKA